MPMKTMSFSKEKKKLAKDFVSDRDSVNAVLEKGDTIFKDDEGRVFFFYQEGDDVVKREIHTREEKAIPMPAPTIINHSDSFVVTRASYRPDMDSFKLSSGMGKVVGSKKSLEEEVGGSVLVPRMKRGIGSFFRNLAASVAFISASYIPFGLTGCGGGGDSPSGPVSESPVFIPAGKESVLGDENSLISYTPTVTDPQGDPVTFSISNKPIWATFNTSTGEVSGTPSYTDSGTYNSVITAMDSKFNTSVKDLEIIVNNVNRAPVISSTGTTTVNEGNVIEVQFDVTDPDGDSPIDFWINNAPLDSTFDSGTKTLSWITNYTDGDANPGITTLQLVADDRKGGVTNQNLDLVVNNVVNPDRIICVYNDSTWKLASLLSDGSDVQVISAPGDFKGRPRWYPNDKSLITYFRSDTLISPWNLRIANSDGSAEQKIINEPIFENIHPVISPDNTKGAFQSDEQGYFKVYLFDWNDATKTASNVRQLNSNTNEETWPVFSPDSQWVYYSAKKGSNWEICKYRSNQTGLEQNLTNNPADDFVDNLSDDGIKMLINSNRNSGILNLYMANSDGTSPIQLTNSLTDTGTSNFSPDGNWIVYSINGDLYKIRKDGKYNRMISEGSYDYYDPDW